MNYHNMTTDELLREAVSLNHPLLQELVKRFPLLPPFAEDLDLVELMKLDELMTCEDLTADDIVRDYRDMELKLSDFLASDWFNHWDADNRNEMDFKNPERAARLHEAAEDGSDGSTHGERIGDMADALNAAWRDGELGPLTTRRLQMEADALQEWFANRGELDVQIG